MKNNKKFIKSGTSLILMLLALILLATLFVSSSRQYVRAEELDLDDSKVIEQGYGIYKIQDQALYDALWNELITRQPNAENLTVGAFKDLNIEEFNFSGKNISSLVGLNLIKLPNLKRLILSNNNIAGSVEGFEFMTNLEQIDLSNNKVTSFDSSFSNKLKNINLSNNNISIVKLSNLLEGGEINLSFNNIKTFSNLTLPQTACTINLTHNYLVEELPTTECTLKMGFQGIKNGDDILKATKICFYELEGVENLKLYKKLSDGSYILSETIMPNNELTNLDISEYKLVFTETNEPKLYADLTFTCRPNAPTISVFENDKLLTEENHIFNKIIKLKIEAEGEIYYQINNGEKIQGNEITIDKGGSYTITYWQKQEGMDSVRQSFLVISKYFAPINYVWIVLVLAVFVIAFLFAIYYKNTLQYKKTAKGSRKDFD